MNQPINPVKLLSAVYRSSDVRELSFGRLDGGKLPLFTPGAHILLKHPKGKIRRYSLINPPTERERYTIAVRRRGDGLGGSIAFHDDLEVGDELLISDPVTGMSLKDDSVRHLFIAGGIGVTPILGMLRSLDPIEAAEIIYCVRDRADAPYLEVLESFDYPVTVYDQSKGEILPVIHTISSQPRGTTIYHCGPPGLMQAIEDAAVDWDLGTVLSESFEGLAEVTTGAKPFEVELVESDGRVITVGTDETMLQALLREKISVDYSCQAGECGTCITGYLSGNVEHHDQILDDDERTEMVTPCVSRAVGRLCLEL